MREKHGKIRERHSGGLQSPPLHRRNRIGIHQQPRELQQRLRQRQQLQSSFGQLCLLGGGFHSERAVHTLAHSEHNRVLGRGDVQGQGREADNSGAIHEDAEILPGNLQNDVDRQSRHALIGFFRFSQGKSNGLHSRSAES